MLSWITSKISGHRDSFEYISWIDKVTQAGHLFLEHISARHFAKKDGKPSQDLELRKLVHELDVLLQVPVAQSDIRKVHENAEQHHSRRKGKSKGVGGVLLLLTNLIVGYLSTMPSSGKESSLLVNILYRVLIRPEFDFNPNDKMDLYYKEETLISYKHSIENVFALVKSVLKDLVIPDISMNLSDNSILLSYAKILSILYFRYPHFGHFISESIKFSDSEAEKKRIYDFDKMYSKYVLKKEQHRAWLMNAQLGTVQSNNIHIFEDFSWLGNEKTSALASIASKMDHLCNLSDFNCKQPVFIHYWDWLYKLYPSATAPVESTSHEIYIQALQNGESLFFLHTMKEILIYVLNKSNNVETMPKDTFPGYENLELRFLSLFRRTAPEKLTQALMLVSKLLLSFNPSLINFYIRHVFKRTNVKNTTSVIEALAKLNQWFNFFKESKQAIPNSFDYEFLLQGLDMVLVFDHHLLVCRVLSFFYNNFYLFQGEPRVMTHNFLLTKHFDLFSHWDQLVRLYYHHCIIYKLTRLRKVGHNQFAETRTGPKIVYDDDGFMVSCPKSEVKIDIMAMRIFKENLLELEDQIRDDVKTPKKFSISLTQYKKRLSRWDPSKLSPSLPFIVDDVASTPGKISNHVK